MFHSELSTAEENGQRPLPINPPGVLRPRPAASAMEDAIRAPGAGVTRERGLTPGVRVRTPNCALAPGVGLPEAPAWRGAVTQAPAGGRAGTHNRRRDAAVRHEVKLHPAEGLGLVKPEQPT